MLDLAQIESFYPESLRPFKRNLLREYLQYKILETIYDSQFGAKLIFMGGTSLRIIHGNTRFSEDLDFDNLGMRKDEFGRLSGLFERRLALEGYEVELKNVFRKAFTCEIRLPGVLFAYGLSGHRQEKLLVKLNAEPQDFPYPPDKVILNKFDVFLRVNVAPADVLLAQKIFATFNRKRPMGRDFYDIVFLLGKARPNLDYLRSKMGVRDSGDLKRRLLKRCRELDFDALAREVEPFLFVPSDAKRVRGFRHYLEGMEL
ncbi:MAG: nucleotidyl transferase AbiEii/AbiGii toxin family protein [Actinobacteria bacterium]|nr:nucleotidyl transferase AbiEii/AbiGii toxin family protein [Actinomycetota bacterium]